MCPRIPAYILNDTQFLLFCSDCAQKEPISLVQDDVLAQKLWDLSMKTVGLARQDQGTQT